MARFVDSAEANDSDSTVVQRFSQSKFILLLTGLVLLPMGSILLLLKKYFIDQTVGGSTNIVNYYLHQ